MNAEIETCPITNQDKILGSVRTNDMLCIYILQSQCNIAEKFLARTVRGAYSIKYIEVSTTVKFLHAPTSACFTSGRDLKESN